MRTKNIIKQFINRYGSTIVRLDGMKAKGLCTRIDNHDTDVETVSFERLGYVVKREFLLITASDCTLLQPNVEVLCNQRRLKIISVDTTDHQDEMMCRRAYAFEIKEVFT